MSAWVSCRYVYVCPLFLEPPSPTFFFFLIFIYLAALGLSCSIRDLVPWQGLNPGPLHWEHGVLAPCWGTSREVPLLPIFNYNIFFVVLAIELYEFFIYFRYFLSDTWFENISPHSVDCLFILLMVSFVVQKLFSLMQSHFFIFTFIAYAIGVILQEFIAKTNNKEFFFFCILLRTLVSDLTFQSLIHFELIFVSGVN